jgi:hypothetical protein
MKKICENCGVEHSGGYASGRFCSSKCSHSFVSNMDRQAKNKKVSDIMKRKMAAGLQIGAVKVNNDSVVENICPICGAHYYTRQFARRLKNATCSSECAVILRVQSYKNNVSKLVGGYRKGSGRGKSGWYKGYWCDSSYELAYVIYNLEHSIIFTRNTEVFEYTWNSETHTYCPDFVKDGTLIEIKGYETEQTKMKYASVHKPLTILQKKNMKEIFTYVEEKYGKDYINLYDGNPHNKLTGNCQFCGKECKSKSTYCSRSCAMKANRLIGLKK